MNKMSALFKVIFCQSCGFGKIANTDSGCERCGGCEFNSAHPNEIFGRRWAVSEREAEILRVERISPE